MTTHYSILAWGISKTEEPGGLQSMGHKESDTTEQLTFPPMSSVSPKLQYYSAIDRSPVSVLKKSQLLHIYVDVGKMEETSCKRQDTGDRARVQRKQKLKTREQRPPNLQQRVKGQGCWFQASHSYAVVSNSL